jgi:hypothetical protein
MKKKQEAEEIYLTYVTTFPLTCTKQKKIVQFFQVFVTCDVSCWELFKIFCPIFLVSNFGTRCRRQPHKMADRQTDSKKNLFGIPSCGSLYSEA